MKTYQITVSDQGSSCEFTVTSGQIQSITHSRGIPVEKVLSSADLSGNASELKSEVEAAFNANGSEYEATVEEVEYEATIAEALASLDPSAILCDLPDSEFVTGGAITDACRAAGYDESGRVVINNMRAWNMTVAQFAKSISPE